MNFYAIRFGLLWLLFCLPGCVSHPAQPVELLPDVWGGEHIRLQIESSGATVEYDCAHGTIDAPLTPDQDGNFAASGTHTAEHGGPVRQDEPSNQQAAAYQGWTDGRVMRLTVTLTATNSLFGTFTLHSGESGNLFKCY